MKSLLSGLISFSGGNFKVHSFESRPRMVIMPPPRSSDSRPQQMGFIKAVTSLRCNLSDENLIMIFQTVGEHERGNLRRLFVILDDDSHDQSLSLVKSYHESRRRLGRQTGSGSLPLTHTGSTAGNGIGMEVSGSLINSLRQPPPPPPPGGSSGHTRSSSVVDGGSKPDRQSDSSDLESPENSRKRARRSPSTSSGSSSCSSSSSSSSGSRRKRHSKKKNKSKSKSKSKSKKSRK